MEAVITCLIHEGITPKLGKCLYMENRIHRKAREGMYLAIFIYFSAASCREGR